MAIDLSKFAKAFYEEARDHLAAMESLLVAIDLSCANDRTPDDESLNALFRAVHSVKGGAAAFGHAELTEFTHDVETILDRVRKRQLQPTRSMITLMLQAGDVMRAHIAALDQDIEPDARSMAPLRALLLAACSDEGVAVTAAAAEGTPPTAERLLVKLALDPVEFVDAASVASLLEKLDGLGRRAAVEMLEEADGARTLSFELELAADSDEGELRDALSFLFGDEAIQVRPLLPPQDDCDDSFGFFAPFDNAPGGIETPVPAMPAAIPHAATELSTGAALFSDASSIRVSVAKVDSLINLVGELVITEAMMAESARGFAFDLQGRFAAALAQLERNTRDLQESILSIRMMPISFIFSRLPRLARDVAGRLDKEVELEMVGEDTELDKGLIERITDPLIHLVRNAIDHGIESPENRVRAGKSAKGRLTVRARHQGGMIVITVDDDGAGLDRTRILAKAAELGIATDAAWTDRQVWRLVFLPGFSTSGTVTDVSGRGVGMDVVGSNVAALGGSVEIDSTAGQGTTVTICLPLTLAILDGMTIAAAGETYILPLANISQSIQSAPGQVSTVGGREMLSLAGEYIPVVGFADVFAGVETRESGNVLVIVEADGRRAALRVQELLGQHQVVLKSLEDNYRKVGGLSGATILGDGRVAFIMDVSYLVNAAHGQFQTRKVHRGPLVAA